MAEPAVTRFAPSPTGHLHVGGARTALFNWALARRTGGRFVLRIEDTDQARSSEQAVAGILEDLAWLGIAWDEGPEWRTPDGRVLGGDARGVGPFFQARRLERYAAAIDRLLEADRAYPAFESPEALETERQRAQAEKRNFRYRRPPQYDRKAALARMVSEPHVIRLRMPDGPIRVADQILGEITFGEDELDDFVLRRRDGFPTYHLAVVVDDEAMGVTHVLRAQEHLNNTPKHVALQRALGFRVPVYAHLPVIMNPDGSKMSKRDKDRAARQALRERLETDPTALDQLREPPPERLRGWLAEKRSQLDPDELRALADGLGLELPGIDVEDFRRAGYLPEVVCNFLALLGWSPGEKDAEGRDLERFDRAFLASRFSLERVGKANARFDRARLMAFSQDALGALTQEEFYQAWRAWCARYRPEVLRHLEPVAARRFAAALQPRSRTLAEPTAPDGPGRFALVADDGYDFDEAAVAKWLRRGEPSGLALLAETRPLLAHLESFEPQAIEMAVGTFCEERGLGMGKVAQPLRVAVTGRAASPPLGDTLAILGRPSVLARVDRCLAECAG